MGSGVCAMATSGLPTLFTQLDAIRAPACSPASLLRWPSAPSPSSHTGPLGANLGTRGLQGRPAVHVRPSTATPQRMR